MLYVVHPVYIQSLYYGIWVYELLALPLVLNSGTASIPTSCLVHLSILHLFVPWSCSFIISFYFLFFLLFSFHIGFSLSLSLYVLKVAFWLTCEFYMIP